MSVHPDVIELTADAGVRFDGLAVRFHAPDVVACLKVAADILNSQLDHNELEGDIGLQAPVFSFSSSVLGAEATGCYDANTPMAPRPREIGTLPEGDESTGICYVSITLTLDAKDNTTTTSSSFFPTSSSSGEQDLRCTFQNVGQHHQAVVNYVPHGKEEEEECEEEYEEECEGAGLEESSEGWPSVDKEDNEDEEQSTSAPQTVTGQRSYKCVAALLVVVLYAGIFL
ncbi:hypothetical protein F5X99DRAFT_403730 [Biscogniauxia marginata]|nr:hypothetical protein F5X99DRAFT_403730 [Biscogniauxia marginata]